MDGGLPKQRSKQELGSMREVRMNQNASYFKTMNKDKYDRTPEKERMFQEGINRVHKYNSILEIVENESAELEEGISQIDIIIAKKERMDNRQRLAEMKLKADQVLRVQIY